jgi:hypothetical protein
MTEKLPCSTLTWVSIRRETRNALICKEAGSEGVSRHGVTRRLSSTHLALRCADSEVAPSLHAATRSQGISVTGPPRERGEGMSIWGEERSKLGRCIADALILLISGYALFVMSTYLVEPFRMLVDAFAKSSFLEEPRAWLRACSYVLPWGFAWLAFFMVFEVVKTDLLEVLARDEADHARARMSTRAESERRTLSRWRRALLVQQRLTGVRRRL